MIRLQFIKAAGVELEGGWLNQPQGAYGDGSVSSFRNMFSGEIASSPSREGSLKKLVPWILAHYPDKVDDSCGYHVHLSLKEKSHYEMLMTHTFPMWVRCCAARWAKAKGIWNDANLQRRIICGNDYCRRIYQAERQVKLEEKKSERYCQLNYCYALHKTIELRMMPMFPGPRENSSPWNGLYITSTALKSS